MGINTADNFLDKKNDIESNIENVMFVMHLIISKKKNDT